MKIVQIKINKWAVCVLTFSSFNEKIWIKNYALAHTVRFEGISRNQEQSLYPQSIDITAQVEKHQVNPMTNLKKR